MERRENNKKRRKTRESPWNKCGREETDSPKEAWQGLSGHGVSKLMGTSVEKIKVTSLYCIHNVSDFCSKKLVNRRTQGWAPVSDHWRIRLPPWSENPRWRRVHWLSSFAPTPWKWAQSCHRRPGRSEEIHFSYSTPRFALAESVCAAAASPFLLRTESSGRHRTSRGAAVMAIAVIARRVAGNHRRRSGCQRAGAPRGRPLKWASWIAWTHSTWSSARLASPAALICLEEMTRWMRSRGRRRRQSVRTASDRDDTEECLRWPELKRWSVRGSRHVDQSAACMLWWTGRSMANLHH